MDQQEASELRTVVAELRVLIVELRAEFALIKRVLNGEDPEGLHDLDALVCCTCKQLKKSGHLNCLYCGGTNFN